MKTIKTSIAGFILFVIVVSGFFMTCEIGLGDAVDTKPPTVSITYPPAVSIIRGAFTLAGTAADETGLNRVEVTYSGRSGASNGVTTLVGKAEINKENNTWSIIVPAPVHDGDYDFLVEAVDNASRRTPVSRSFKIDNTPPMLVLQRPSTRGTVDPSLLDPFGAELLFNGNWWDLNGTTGCALIINFYKEDKTLLGTHKTTLNVQSWEVSLEAGLPLWTTLYSACKDGGVDKIVTPFWYTISLEDDAYEYKNPAEAELKVGKTGNITEHYYLYRDIVKNLVQGEQYPNLALLSAFENTGADAGIPAGLIASLNSLKIPAAPSALLANMGKFSFDPDNKDPSISIDNLKNPSYAPVSSPDDNKLPPLPSINIKIEPNKDGTAIIPASIEIVLTKFNDDRSTLSDKPEDRKIYKENDGFTIVPIPPISSITLSLDTPDGDYQLEISVKDLDNHEANAKYGFTINTGAPTLVSVSPDKISSYEHNGENIQVTKVNTDETTNDRFKVIIKGTDGDQTVKLIATEIISGINQPSIFYTVEPVKKGSVWHYEWEIFIENLIELEPRTFRFTLNDTFYDSTPRTITFLADNTLPVLESIITPIENHPLTPGIAVVNTSQVAIRGYATSDLEKALFVCTKSPVAPTALPLGDWTAGLVEYTATVEGKGFSANIPVIKGNADPDEGIYYLWARFADDTFSEELNNYGPALPYSLVEPSFKVMYDKSNPVFTETNSGITGTALVYKKTDVTFGGVLSDGNGIKSVVVTYSKNGEESVGLPINTSVVDTWSATLETGLGDGSYELEFTATDNAGKKTSFTRNVMIDTASPLLFITAPITGEGVSGNAYTIRGTVDDGSGKGVSTIEHSVNSTNGTDGDWFIITKAASWNKVVDFSGAEGLKNLWVRASDGLNTSTVKHVDFQFDSLSPAITVSPLPPYNSTGSVSLGGTWTETNKLTSIRIRSKKDGGVFTLRETISINNTGTDIVWSAGPYALADGSYEFEILATDIAGRTGSVSAFSILDATPPVPVISSPLDNSAVAEIQTFSGGATDAVSGVASVEYRFDEVSSWTLANGSVVWNATATITGAEGPRTLYVRSTDTVGNASAPITRNYRYDKTVPEVTITDAASRDVNAMYTLSGTATDGYGIETISVTQKRDSGTAVEVAGSSFTEGGTVQNRTWTLENLPRDSGTPATHLLADGTYTYEVRATDLAGKTSLIASATVRVDNTAPSITITAPTSSPAQTGVNALSGSAYLFRGTAIDAGVGVAKIWYVINNSITAPVFSDIIYTELVTSGNWSFERSLPGDLPEGSNYYLHVLAEDSSGNFTDLADVASVLFDVDLANPTATMAVSATAKGLTELGVELREVAFTLSGTCDDNTATATRRPASVVLTATRNGVSLGPLTLTTGGASTGSWTYNQAVNTVSHANDGLYVYTLTVTDSASKVTVATKTVRIDTTGPTIAITQPTGAQGSSSITIEGYAMDGSGVGFSGTNDVQYSWNNVDWTSFVGAEWDGTYGWNKAVTIPDLEGSKTLYLRSYDKLGNMGAKSVTFFYDRAAPELTEEKEAPYNGVGTTDTQYKNGSLDFGGTVKDSNTTGPIVLSVKVNSAAPESIGSFTADDTYKTWSWTFPSSVAGTYSLVFTATDAANRTTSITRTVVVDKNIPTINNFIGVDSSTWYTAASRLVSGAASDTGGSGLQRIEYRISANNGTDWGVWTSLTETTSFNGTVSFEDGNDNLIQVRAVDRAGNISVETQRTVWVDTLDPSFNITSPLTTPVSNGSGSLAINIEASDDTSGPVTVYAKVGSYAWGTDTTNYPEYSATITDIDPGVDVTWGSTLNIIDLSKLAPGNQKIYLRVRDAAGRYSAVIGQSILIDKTAPTVSITTPTAGATVNKTISLSGTASDANGLGSTGVFEIQRQSDNVWVTAPSGTLTVGNSWTVTGFNTTAITNGGLYDFTADAGISINIRVGIIDAAGNTGYATRTLVVDQDADRPVIRLSNIRPDGTTTLLVDRNVSGSLLDDDGTVLLANFAVSEDGTTWFNATSNPVITNPGNPLYYDVDTRSFQYAPSAGDGQKYIYFKVTDLAGAIFTTPVTYDAGNILAYPKVQFGADSGSSIGARVAFKIDTNPPDLSSDIYVDSTSPWTFDGATALDPQNRLLNNTIFGGTRNKFALRVSARDTVGINSVALSIAGNNYAMTKVSGVAGDWEVFTTSAITPIDVSAMPSGIVTVSVVATDNSGQTSSSTRQIVIDNTVPAVVITSHAMNEQVTGDLILRGTATDDSGSGINSVQYRVGTDAAWTPVSGTFSWSIAFTQAASRVITTTASYANTTHAVEQSSGIWRLPITIRATDKIGNVNDYVHYLDIDPDGDKPVVTVLYPDEGSTLGGTIRIFGSAQDNESVSHVWMMIDVDNDGDFDLDDRNYLVGKGYNVVGAGTVLDPYQFEVSGTASWNRSVNNMGGGEFNPAEGQPAKPFSFRVRAQDNNGTYGNWTPAREVFVDNNAPQIGSASPLKLVQYTDGTYTTIAAEKDYVANMYIRGQWFLIGSVWDESGISAINLTGASTATLVSHENTWFIRDGEAVGATSKFNYNLRIPVGYPLGSTVAGSLSYSIYVEDASDPKGVATQSIFLNYDNVSPTPDVPNSGGLPINTTNMIVQSNRNFTFTSEVSESASGFERLVFFFVRRGVQDRVYNPMLGTGHAQNRTNLSALTWDTGDLPRLNLTGVTRPGTDSLSHASLINNENIRKGGLVRIAGVDRVISDVTYATGTVNFSPAVEITYTNAEFAYGLVVNNTTIETGTWVGNTLTGIVNDDGDGMIESVERSGGSYIWGASINSLNIPDGPVELHYVAYDKAGNSTAGSVATFVANNRPRLAKVHIGSDLSGDGGFSSSEIATPYTAVTGSEEFLVNLADSGFRVKGRLAIIPEFVGGNGEVRYLWNTNGAVADPWDGSTYPGAAITGAVFPFVSITEPDTATVHSQAVVIETTRLEAMDDITKLFSVCFWDETDETDPGIDSQWARLNVPLYVDVVDGVAPVTVVDPFFWNSAADNSLFENSKANGHIELEADLPAGIFAGTTGLFDRDPKVSGQISIRGSAYDDQRLGALYLFFGDSGTGQSFNFTGATTKPLGGKTYAQVATYNGTTGLWTGTDQWTANGWKVSVTPDYLSQSGHKVNWQLDIDTSRITGVAALDRLLRVIAEDARPTTPNPSSEALASNPGSDPTNNVPSYRMDVVPYIQTVKTSLSNLKKNNPSVYNRTALGRYPVNTAETVELHGFNLTGATVTGATVTISDGVVSVPMVTIASGNLALTVNSVGLLNNQNNNDVDYNKLPNGDNNYLLTDDVVLDVWQFNNRAASPINGIIANPVMKINPTSGMLGFAFTNGPLYFSMGGRVTNGTRGVPSTGEYSYVYWQGSYDFMTSTAFAYNSAGHTYGAAAGGDINATQADKFSFMTDRWGVSGVATGGSYEGVNALRIEMIAQMGDRDGNDTGTVNFDKERIKSPEYATARHGASTNIYMAYFDNLNEEIRFKYGNLADTQTTKANFVNFNDAYRDGTVNNGNNLNSGLYSTARVQVIASTKLIDRNPGEFVSLGVISVEDALVDDVVVLVWYDSYENRLMYTYNSTPTAGTTGVNATNWSAPVEIFEEGGEYCKLAVDKDGGIHIASYNGMTGDLQYAYLSSYDSANVETCIVDSYGIVGQNITIDVAKDAEDSKNIPYIGYYALSSAKPKLAYLVSETVSDGAIDEVFTGDWEITFIPTATKSPQDTVSVGLWKDANGVIENSTTGTNAYGTNWGCTYGNGTANPVLAYAIRESSTKGYIETAQKK